MKPKTMRISIPRAVMVLFTCTFFFSTVSAQESINTTGGNAKSSEGSVSYSIGQLTYQIQTGANGSVAEGVQQPFEISMVTGVEETAITLTISAYPNPATDFLTLEVKDFEHSSLIFKLYDLLGRLIQTEKITSNQTTIVMSSLEPSTYFIKVIEDNKEIKTFKIIKTN